MTNSDNSKNVREYSFEILYNVIFYDKLLNNEIERVYQTYDISDNDKSYIKKECTGVIENIESIDTIINEYSKVKTNKLKHEILIVFRISVYEILYLDKVPEYATINEAVNIIKTKKCRNLSGYVNATLKNIAKNKTKNKESDKNNNLNKYCYFKIVNNDDTLTLNELNNLHINYYPYDGKLLFKHTNIYYTDSYKNIINTNSFKNGNIIIQDASSAYLVDKLYDLISEEYDSCQDKIKILDTCSSPGGKIISLYFLFNNDNRDGYFEARDISEYKTNIISENIKRLKIKNMQVKAYDATNYIKDDFEKYDIVLCDVPCSGTGVINKKPDIKLRINDSKTKSLKTIQQNILDVSKNYVKIGGIISYSTCTETKEENEDNINEFTDKNPSFEKIYEKKILSKDDNKADGFYMCFLKKINEHKKLYN